MLVISAYKVAGLTSGSPKSPCKSTLLKSVHQTSLNSGTELHYLLSALLTVIGDSQQWPVGSVTVINTRAQYSLGVSL